MNKVCILLLVFFVTSIGSQWVYGPPYQAYGYGYPPPLPPPRYYGGYGYRPAYGYGYNPYVYQPYGYRNPVGGAVRGALVGAALGALVGKK